MKPPVAPEIGKEYPQPNEVKTANTIIKLLKAQMLRLYSSKGKKQLRQVHTKINGCAKAQFIIHDLPPELRVGVFKEPKTYPAWIRFSNGESHIIPDAKKDFRGFAIKLMGVPGKKLDENDQDSGMQDFVFMNNRTFFVQDAAGFAEVLYVVTTPHYPWSIPKKIGIFLKNIPLLKRAMKAKVVIRHPAEIPYYSTTPYRFGDESKAVKYGVFPTTIHKLIYPDTSSENFLFNNMAATLKENQLEYDFCIQFQTDAAAMPIEDPTVEWKSPFTKLATIRIPAQDIKTSERMEIGEDLPFNIWHTIAEHRPLGIFNRVRKIIYEEMYTFRHSHNNIKHADTVAGPDFFNDTKFENNE